MGSRPSKAAGKKKSEPDNDDPIKLNTIGETNSTADLGTNATPDGIDKDTAAPETDTKPETTSVDQDATDGMLQAVLNASPDITMDCNTEPTETATEIPPPPSPPPVDVAVNLAEYIPPPPSPPPIIVAADVLPPPPETTTPSSSGNIPPPPSPPPVANVPPPPSPPTIQDTSSEPVSADPAKAHIAEPNEAVVNSDNTVQTQSFADPKENIVTIHETAAGASPPAPKLSTFGHPVTTNSINTSVDEANSGNTPHETVVTVFSPAPKLSTFGTPILAVDTESPPNDNNTAEQSKPEDKAVNDVTITSQSQDAKTETTTNLSKQDGKSLSPDVQADAKTQDDGKEVEIKPTLDDIPPPLLMSDDTVECTSLESAGDMKKRLFGTEFDPEEDVNKKKGSMVRFYILLIMATATFTLVSVVVALILFINLADLNTILGVRLGGDSTNSTAKVDGEIRMQGLNLSSLQPWTKESLKAHFINLTEKAFINSAYSGLYERTTITEPLGQGSVIVKFTVQLMPIVRSKSSNVVHDDDMYCSYKAATTYLKGALDSMEISGSSGVSVVKLNLYVGSKVVFDVSPTTEKPNHPGSPTTGPLQVPSPTKLPASPLATTTHLPSSTMKSTSQTYSSSSTMQYSGEQPSTTTTKSSPPTSMLTTQTQALASTEMALTPTVNMPTTQTTTLSGVTTIMAPSTQTNQSAASTQTDMATTEEASATPMNKSAVGVRRRRETRSLLEITTNQFTKQPVTNHLVQSVTRYTTDISVPVCSPHPLHSCIHAGWSKNTTMTPNRYNLWSDTNQLVQTYTKLMQDVDVASQHGVELQKIICSLLAPSCDDGLMGRNLPCRSACANLVQTLKDPTEAGALAALCNTALPDSESGSICFQIQSQNSDTRSACSSGHCLNGGSCFDLNGQAYCRCSKEFGGDRCHIDPCTPNHCANGGTCLGRAELITSYACGCQAGYHGKHCELSADVLPTPSVPSEPFPSTIRVPSCLDVLPYGQFISDTRAPGWGIVKPFASCSTDARIMFCAMAHPEFYPSTLVYHRRAPCKDVCQRVFFECDILFHALDRVFPGICEGLGTNQTEVEHFCTTN